MTTDEPDRHQKEYRDRVVQVLRDLDAAVNQFAKHAQREAQRNRREQVSPSECSILSMDRFPWLNDQLRKTARSL